MILEQEKSLLLIVDVQEKLLNAVFNKETLEKKATILAKTSLILQLPVFVTEQYPQGLGQTISDLKKEARCFEKVAFNALEDKNLLEMIKNTGKKQIIICGIETHICVHQTVCALLKEGFDVTVALDACGSRAEDEYNFALDNMKYQGANIKTTEMIIFELLRTAKHPAFKEIQALIK